MSGIICCACSLLAISVLQGALTQWRKDFNLWTASPQQFTQSGMMTMFGLLKSGKLILRYANDRGHPDVTSWGTTRESQLGFSHAETQHDGTAQSVVNEVIPRERPGRPDIESHEGAWPQQFVIGIDEAELEEPIESRSFVNRVNDSGAKKTETNFKCYRRWRKTFYDLVNVSDCYNGISGIHGKELIT